MRAAADIIIVFVYFNLRKGIAYIVKAIVNGKIILPDRVVTSKALLFDQQIIGLAEPADIKDATVIDASGMYVSPGLVDMHIHGYLGEDASDGSAEGIVTMAEGIVKNGVTSWLPTTMTVSMDQLRKVFSMMRSLRGQSRDRALWKGAEILGVNAEGPFINPTKKGAQAGDHIVDPDADFILEFADIILVFTLAPEMPGAMECIRKVRAESNILISMGHTDATYAQAVEAIKAGVGHTTHLFNAMTPLNHRDPGVVGAALTTGVYAELITDMFHINPGLFQLVADIKGDKLVLMTDCTRAGGLADGEYTLGGQPIFVKGIECRLADGVIAGSVLKLNNAVRNMMDNTNLSISQIVNMASLNPATAIGCADRKGSLEAGKDADIVIADAQFQIEKTFIAGDECYTKGA